MVLTPFAMRLAPKIGAKVKGRGKRVLGHGQQTGVPGDPHAVVIGFGLTGRRAVENLTEIGVSVTVIDTNLLNTRLARAKGFDTIVGDARQTHILTEAGVDAADLLVVSVNNPDATKAIVQHARHLNPVVTILTRAQYAADEEALRTAGADYVVVAESAAAEKVATLSLQLLPGAPASDRHPSGDDLRDAP
ncbi:MAG: NAD(P)-binding protein, partial [Myxococcota bacterium]